MENARKIIKDLVEGGKHPFKQVEYSGTTYDEIEKILKEEIHKVNSKYKVVLEMNDYEGFISFSNGKNYGAFFLEIAGDTLMIMGITIPEELRGKGILNSTLKRIHDELKIKKCKVLGPQNEIKWKNLVEKSGMIFLSE